MANQQNSYTVSDGSGTNNRDFSYTFPSFLESEVKVEIDNVVKTLTTHYTIVNHNNTSGGTVRFNATGLPDGTAGTTPVRIFRQTDVEAAKAEFTAGSSLKAQEINDNFKQLRHALQEAIGANATDRKVQPFNIEDGAITSAAIKDLTIARGDIANDAIDGTKIEDDAINSEHYAAASVDTEHIALENITTALLAPDAVVSSKLADNAVNSEHYVDGSIDHEHLANDIIDGDNIQDDVINSEHYVAGSIDHEHLANDIIDGDNIQDDVINSEHYVAGSIDHEHLANDIIDGDNIQDNAVNTEHIQANAVTDAEIETGTLDNRYFTETESDARYFRQDSSETISSGDTWTGSDAYVATTGAIDARIVDLVDDVGGFVPIANETSFPTTNPDVNDGPGTLISIREIASTRTPNTGTVTIANGAGSNTVTISNCGSTVLSAGYGVIVETTSVTHTYQFHRLAPKATEVTTVAGKATEIGRLGTAAAVEDMSILGTTDVVADMAILGTTDVVADMNTLATSDIVSDMNTLAVTDVINDMDTVATNVANVNTVGGSISNVNTTAGSIANVNTVAGSIANVNTTAGSISNVNTTAGSISNVNTVASNITNVNNFANRYRIASSAPNTDNDEGDLYFDTTSDELRVYNGSAWQGGVTATGNLAGTGSNTFTGNQTIQNTEPTLFLTDTDSNSDFAIKNHNGTFDIRDTTNGSDRLRIASDGTISSLANHDFSAGIDVTGNITVTGHVDGRDIADMGTKLDGIETGAKDDQTAAEIKTLLDSNGIVNSNVDASAAIAGSKISPNFGSQGIDGGALTITGDVPTITLTDANNNPDYKLIVNGGTFLIHDSTNGTDKIKIQNNAEIDITPNVDFANGIDVTGAITSTGDITITNDIPRINFIDSGDNPDWEIGNINGAFRFRDTTNAATWMQINTDGHVDINGNLDVGAGIDVTGHATVSQSLTVSGGYVYAEGGLHIENSDPRINLVDTNGNPDYHIRNSGGSLVIRNTTNGVNNLVINGSGELTTGGNVYVGNNLDVAAGVDVTGNITVTGTVDGVDIAAFKTSFDNLSTDIVNDTTPQLGGDLDTNSFEILLDDAHAVKFGDSQDLSILHSGSNSRITHSGTGNLVVETTASGSDLTLRAQDDAFLQCNNGNEGVRCIGGGATELYYNNTKKFETTSSGVNIASGNFQIGGTNIINDGLALYNIDSIKLADTKKAIFGASNDMEIYHSSGTNYIGAAQDQDLVLFTNNSSRWKIQNTGHYIPASDSNYDIGTNSVRVRNGYFDTVYGDGSNLTGISAGAQGGGSDEVFWCNGQSVDSDFTIPDGKNAMSAGPITISNNVTVTVGAGETWTVV